MNNNYSSDDDDDDDETITKYDRLLNEKIQIFEKLRQDSIFDKEQLSEYKNDILRNKLALKRKEKEKEKQIQITADSLLKLNNKINGNNINNNNNNNNNNATTNTPSATVITLTTATSSIKTSSLSDHQEDNFNPSWAQTRGDGGKKGEGLGKEPMDQSSEKDTLIRRHSAPISNHHTNKNQGVQFQTNKENGKVDNITKKDSNDGILGSGFGGGGLNKKNKLLGFDSLPEYDLSPSLSKSVNPKKQSSGNTKNVSFLPSAFSTSQTPSSSSSSESLFSSTLPILPTSPSKPIKNEHRPISSPISIMKNDKSLKAASSRRR